jgi:hypothetical protein
MKHPNDLPSPFFWGDLPILFVLSISAVMKLAEIPSMESLNEHSHALPSWAGWMATRSGVAFASFLELSLFVGLIVPQVRRFSRLAIMVVFPLFLAFICALIIDVGTAAGCGCLGPVEIPDIPHVALLVGLSLLAVAGVKRDCAFSKAASSDQNVA